MSGCPILQKGKIIGAVTHVFVNNPTKDIRKDYHEKLTDKNLIDNVWNMEVDATKEDLTFVVESLISSKFDKFYNSLY